MTSDEHAVTAEPALAVQATLAAWREQGAHKVAPMRFVFIEALARRAATHGGETRRLLDEKLAQAVASYADDLQDTAKTAPTDENRAEDAPPPSQPRSALSGLLDHLAEVHPNRSETDRRAWHSTPQQVSESRLNTLTHLRKTWAQLSAAHRVKQALASTPPKAGPLNSQQLVHRSLLLMREVSPAYLQHFVVTIDALSWAQQLHSSNTPTTTTTASARSRSKATRGKSD